MALFDDYLAGKLGEEDSLLKKSFAGELYAEDFLKATPAERQRYLTHNQFTERGASPDVAAGHALRGVVQSKYDNSAMTSGQLSQALSGIDPSLAQAAASQLGGLVTQQQQDKGASGILGSVNSVMNPVTDFLSKYQDMFVPAVGAALFGGAGAFGGATGAADAAAGLESASGGGTIAAGSGGSLGGGLGSGLSTGAGGITGITPGVASTGIGGGALGSGIGASTGSLGAFGGFGTAGLAGLATGAGQAAGSAIGGASGGATGGAASGLGGLLSNPSLIGAGLGALAGGLGGSEQAGTTTTTQDIPEWLRPYYQNMLGGATSAFNQMPKTSPVMGAAENEYMKTLQGDYLNPSTNPYLSQTFDLGAGKIKAGISPTFGHMQAFGSNSGYNQAVGRSLGDFATNLYGGNYNAERGRQASAMAGAPSFTTGGYEAAFAPFSQYKNLLNTGGSQTTSPYFENKLGSMLGGAMTGYGLGRMFK